MNETAAKLRRQAEFIRRAAAVPTTGGHRADQLMIEVAEKLEREADAIERREPDTPEEAG
jgi:hypothetical protein